MESGANVEMPEERQAEAPEVRVEAPEVRVEAPEVRVEMPEERQAEAPEVQGEAGSGKAEASAPHRGSHFRQRQAEIDPTDPAARILAPEEEGLRTVYVANLDWSVDEAVLHGLFQQVDGLCEIRLVRDHLKRSKGFAYVDYKGPEEVKEAVGKFNGCLINKRPIKVAPSFPTKSLFEERTVFVKGFGADVTADDIRETFAAVAEVAVVRLPSDGSAKGHRGHAYVDLADAAGVGLVLAMAGPRVRGHKVAVSRSIPMKDHRHHTAGNRKDLPQHVNQHQILQGKREREDQTSLYAKHCTTVHVKNISFNADEAAIRQHFAQCGEVERLLLPLNEKGRSQGFAFVQYGNAGDAQTALMLSGSMLRGRKLVVSQSTRAISEKKWDRPGETQSGGGVQEATSESLSFRAGASADEVQVADGRGDKRMPFRAASATTGSCVGNWLQGIVDLGDALVTPFARKRRARVSLAEGGCKSPRLGADEEPCGRSGPDRSSDDGHPPTAPSSGSVDEGVVDLGDALVTPFVKKRRTRVSLAEGCCKSARLGADEEPRGRSGHDRSADDGHPPTAPSGGNVDEVAQPTAEAAPAPMTNADFRALVLGFP